MMSVYSVMLKQICLEYHCLPDINKMTFSQIRFFYDGIREHLKKAHKHG